MTDDEIKQLYIDYVYESITSDYRELLGWAYEQIASHADYLDMDSMRAYLRVRGAFDELGYDPDEPRGEY